MIYVLTLCGPIVKSTTCVLEQYGLSATAQHFGLGAADRSSLPLVHCMANYA